MIRWLLRVLADRWIVSVPQAERPCTRPGCTLPRPHGHYS